MSPRPPFPPSPRKTTKHRVVIGMMLAVVLAGGLFSFLSSSSKTPRHVASKPDVIMITLPPPPPPPPLPKVEPPPPIEEPPKVDEMVEQEPDPLEEPPPEAPAEPPSEVLGTNIKGDGPGLAGLGSSGNGGGNRNSIGGGGSAQARIDWFAKRILVSSIKEALERDPATRMIVLDQGIRVWVDKTGCVTRVMSLGPTSNLAALQKVLVGLRTSQAPPTGMPSSIDIRISARKPSR
jgi:protein TonB